LGEVAAGLHIAKVNRAQTFHIQRKAKVLPKVDGFFGQNGKIIESKLQLSAKHQNEKVTAYSVNDVISCK